jgi:hypothetical protein
MTHDQVWRHFIQQSASDLLAGRLTTIHFRQALKNPRIRTAASKYDFRASVLAACRQQSPFVASQSALMLEIDAADRRFTRLLECYFERGSTRGRGHAERLSRAQ